MKTIRSRGPIIIGVVVACALAFAVFFDPVADTDTDKLSAGTDTSVAVADTDTDTDKKDLFVLHPSTNNLVHPKMEETVGSAIFNEPMNNLLECDGCEPYYIQCFRTIWEQLDVFERTVTTDTDTDKLSAGTTRADPKPTVLKAGFDPLVVGCCFAVMLFVAWWQKRRAFGRDMAICANTCVGEMALPAPILFKRGALASARKKEDFTPAVISLVAMTGNNGHDLGKESEIALSFGSREQKRNDRLYNLYIKAFMGEKRNQIGRHYLLNCLLHQLPHKAELIRKAFEDTELAA